MDRSSLNLGATTCYILLPNDFPLPNECTSAVGFKCMLNQGILENHKMTVSYFNRKGVTPIFLFRRNLLHRLISILANVHDQNTKQLNGTHKARVHSKHEQDTNQTATDSLEHFKSTRHIVLYYEDLIRNKTVSKHGPKKKAALVGTTSLNLADFASGANEMNDISLSLSQSKVESHHSLNLTIRLIELGHGQESFDTILKSPASLSSAPLSPSSGDSVISEKDQFSSLISGLRKVMNWKDFVSIRKRKNNGRDEGSSEGNYSYKSEDVDSPYPFDNDSSNSNADVNEGDTEEDEDLIVTKSCNYGPLAVANVFGGILGKQESLIYYKHNKLDLECSYNDSMVLLHSWNQDMLQSSKRTILPWRKTKLGFRSPKAKGEPLLKKGNREEGGDDIDHDRRFLSSSDDSLSGSKLYNLGRRRVMVTGT